MKYAYFSGCMAQGSTKELYIASRRVASVLGLELVDVPNFSCCGAGIIRDFSESLDITINARNLALARVNGLDILVTCSTCQDMLSSANRLLNESQDQAVKTQESLSTIGLKYDGGVNVLHLIHVLTQEDILKSLHKKVVHPLRGIKAYIWYGCHLTCGLNAIQVRRLKDLSENLFQALDVELVIPEETGRCCGFPILFVKEDKAMRMAGNILREAKQVGSDCVVVCDPLCHTAFDIYQRDIERASKVRLGLPILHLPQLVGLAMGIRPKELGLQRHLVSAKSLLARAEL